MQAISSSLAIIMYKAKRCYQAILTLLMSVMKRTCLKAASILNTVIYNAVETCRRQRRTPRQRIWRNCD
jgi:hypothetical protein